MSGATPPTRAEVGYLPSQGSFASVTRLSAGLCLCRLADRPAQRVAEWGQSMATGRSSTDDREESKKLRTRTKGNDDARTQAKPRVLCRQWTATVRRRDRASNKCNRSGTEHTPSRMFGAARHVAQFRPACEAFLKQLLTTQACATTLARSGTCRACSSRFDALEVPPRSVPSVRCDIDPMNGSVTNN